MAQQLPCPLPQVREALTPFIRTRQEVLSIRRAQTSHLRSTLPSELSISHVTLGSIPTTNDDPLNTTTSPIAVTDSTSSLHAQYFAALAAHRTAQARYDAAKADIAALTSEPPPTQPTVDRQNGNTPISSSSSSSVVASYVSSLRAQRSQGRADAVLNALERLAELSPHPASVDIKSAVKEALGNEAPAPPADAHLGKGGGASSILDGGKWERLEAMVGGVKRALVRARAGAEEAARERERSERRLRELADGDEAVVPLHVRLQAMDKARADLIAWIEGELSKVGENENGDDDDEEAQDGAVGSNGAHEQDIGADVVNARVQEMYEGYIEARQNLVVSVEAALLDHNQQKEEQQERPTTGGNMSAPSSPQRTRKMTGQSSTSLAALAILPHLPNLISTSRTSASLLQQTSFLRRSLQQSVATTAGTIQRLAGESHLVAPDANNLSAWAQACRTADEKTREMVSEQLDSGRASVEKAGTELAEWRARREAVGRVKGST